mmetsp:Transcript_12325/g.18011  ORF Transcript_12325/g.18011 Transcript_12325/m.18011 type:complete len:904 (+) Transcript_12325:156-2867(+)
MGFIKGPKQLLSSAIVNALDTYFVVDSSNIESKLLGDARIVLRNVALRPIESTVVVDKNTTEESSTTMSVTGNVEEVIFSWKWTTDKKAKTWVEDVNLAILGAMFEVKLEHGDVVVKEKSREVTSSSLSSSQILPDEKMLADVTKNEAKKEGGIQAYVRRHIEEMVDALTLRLENFKIVVTVPNNEGGTTTISIGGESAIIESCGRSQESGGCEKGLADLKQTLSLQGLYASIRNDGEDKESNEEAKSEEKSNDDGQSSIPLLAPFSCSADMRRAGKRFGGFSRGLRALFKSDSTGLVLHAGHDQSYALAQFSVMLLSAKEEETEKVASVSAGATAKPAEAVTNVSAPPKLMIPPAQAFPSKRPSVFDFKLATMAIVVDKQRFHVSDFELSYIADGSKLAFEAKRCALADDGDQINNEECSIIIKNIRGSKNPELDILLGLIERVETTSVRLLSPMKNTRLTFEGDTLTLTIHKLQCAFLTDNSLSEKDESISRKEKTSGNLRNAQTPFPLDVSIEELGLQQNADPDSQMQFDKIQLFANPTPGGTEVAVQTDNFRKNIKAGDNLCLQVSDIVACGRWPMFGSKLVENFKFGANKGQLSDVVSSHIFQLTNDVELASAVDVLSTANISETIANAPKDIVKKSQDIGQNISSTNTSKDADWKLPDAQIDALKIYLSMKIGKKVLSVKNVAFTANPFKGNEKTTSKDLVNHYVSACVKKFPDFATNAEVLGVNIVDIGTNTYGTILGMTGTMAGPFGAVGGVAVMVSVDAVRGTVSAGKKSRGADSADGARPMDLVRGIGYAAADASRTGALKRGKTETQEPNVIDWVVGASVNTEKYLGDNKARIGGAGGAGAGALVGFMVGGPIGGIIGGVIGGVASQKTIEKLDNNKPNDQKQDNKKKMFFF